MITPFRLLKTIQAAGVIYAEMGTSTLTKLELLKLLYIADRESLTARARLITGDVVVAMKNGPVLSHTYDLIKGTGEGSDQWKRFYSTEGKEVRRSQDDPGVGELTRREIAMLRDVANRFKGHKISGLYRYAHDLPEYKKNEPMNQVRQNPISESDRLQAANLSGLAEEILKNGAAEARMLRLIQNS